MANKKIHTFIFASLIVIILSSFLVSATSNQMLSNQDVINLLNKGAYRGGVGVGSTYSCNEYCSSFGETCILSQFRESDNSAYNSEVVRCEFKEQGRQTHCVCGNEADVWENEAGCTPNCAGKTCGDDGCGGSCGSCTFPQTCGGGGIANACGCTVSYTPALNTFCGTKSVTTNCGTTESKTGTLICPTYSVCANGACTKPKYIATCKQCITSGRLWSKKTTCSTYNTACTENPYPCASIISIKLC
jgi:hypothetical protein